MSFFLIGIAGCLVLTPGIALAKKGGNGQFDSQGFWVWFSADPLGAFEPEGPAAGGVVAGAVSNESDPRMLVHSNQSCLDSFLGGMMTFPTALQGSDGFVITAEDFATCFPAGSDWSQGTTVISADGKTVQMNIHGRANSGQDLSYHLIITVTNTGGGWDPLNLARGSSVELLLGEWTLQTANPNRQNQGCSASGSFYNATAIKVQRWLGCRRAGKRNATAASRHSRQSATDQG